MSEANELKIDFLNDHVHYQRKKHHGKQELIAKALGSGKGIQRVFDLTCGLAEDAFFLAQIGFRVTALERSPQIYAILQESLIRAKSQKPDSEILERFEVLFGDSIEFLKSPKFGDLEKSQIALYLDPMFPEKKKAALPRKQMQIFRRLVGDDPDSLDLLKTALASDVARVVVKRPIKAQPLGPGVVHSFEGTTIRYDLYSR